MTQRLTAGTGLTSDGRATSFGSGTPKTCIVFPGQGSASRRDLSLVAVTHPAPLKNLEVCKLMEACSRLQTLFFWVS